MKTLKKTISMLMVASMVLTAGVFTSCDDDDDYNTSQMKGGVSLTAAQMQVTRGSYMQFKGSGLNQITSIVFPNGVAATPEVVDKYTIRCIVPEEATVGTVKLIYAGGEIETAEVLGFNEPVEITEYTKSGKAGDVVTVTGRYLENFTHARFATGEAVALQSVSRNEAKAIVPVDASTGEMVLLYYTQVDGQQIASETPVGDITLAQPAVATIAEVSGIYPGDVITINGTDLNLVQFLTLPGGIKVSEFKGDASVLSFTAPAEMQAGKVVSTSFAGITTELVSVSPKAPTVVSLVNAADAELGNKVKNGKELFINGSDLNLVSRIEFVGADAVTTFTVNEAGTEIKLTMPVMAQSGDVKLIAKSEAIATTKVETIKPVNAGVSAWPVPAGASITFTGTDMDLIKSITLPSGEVLTELTDRSETSFTVKFPHTASGNNNASAQLINGEEVAQFQWLTIESVNYCYPVEIAKSYQAGSTGAIIVANIDKLTGVKIAGEEVTFITYDATTLYLPMTFANVGTKAVEFISGDESYTFDVTIVAGEVEEVLYEEPIQLSAWENHETMVDFSGVPEGATIRLRYTKTADDAALQIFNGHWEMFWAGTDGNDNQAYIQENDYLDIDPSLLPYSDWGYSVIFQGQGLIISSISWVKDFSSGPKAIWEGSSSVTWSGGAVTDLSWGGFDWTMVSAGQTLYVFYDIEDASGVIRLGNGSWSALPSTLSLEGADGDGNVPFNGKTQISIQLTADDIAQLVDAGGLVVCGTGFNCTQIAIK